MALVGRMNYSSVKTETDDLDYEEYFDIDSCDSVIVTLTSTLLSVADLVANVINTWVFVSKGLKSSVDISFLIVTVADLVRILCLLVSTFYLGPLAETMRVPEVLLEVFFVTVGCPMGAAIRVTLHVTVYVTAERCLCLLFPFQVKALITRKVTVCVALTIIAFNSAMLYPIYHSAVVMWDSYEIENITFRNGNSLKSWSESLETVYFFHTLLVVFGLGLLSLFTSILVLQLLKKSSWRAGNAANSVDFLTTRDRKSINLVLVISAFLVISFLPMVSDSLYVIFRPEYYFWETSDSAFHYLYNFSLLCVSANSSLNIVIYYKMSSNYRKTFKRLFILKFNSRIRSFGNLNSVD